MITRLLIANRGEIAIRIARACRELGIESVAVYSDADARAPHVSAADRAVRIGPAAPADSYLSIPQLIAAAREASADALHPGYGFLSEQPALAEACEREGLIFVGPPASVIARMGSKVEARRLMAASGVPVVPGGAPADQSDEALRRLVEHVGLPALIKASAGGGGKGMRVIQSAAEVGAAIDSARREAASAFGDGSLYVERVVEHARHIEVQVFGDRSGRIVHLFERDCSTQRRHQKVIEETPAPGITADLRDRITRAAVRAAEAVGYVGAGTVEFLVDGDGFYFLEMNTRLQVEHPITEEVTGVDLVAAQLLVAAGEPLPWSQDQLSQRGHAIEARLYAEDPSHGFLPQAGRVLVYREPRAPGVRIDSGIAEGCEVPVHYDPLLAKVIASGETRERARVRLMEALRHLPILGIRTNLPLLLAVLEHPRFQAGRTDTTFLDGEMAALLPPEREEIPDFVVAAIAVADAIESGPEAAGRAAHAWDPWTRLTGWRN